MVHPQPCTGSTGRFEQKNFKENTELIYERISDLKNENEEVDSKRISAGAPEKGTPGR